MKIENKQTNTELGNYAQIASYILSGNSIARFNIGQLEIAMELRKRLKDCTDDYFELSEEELIILKHANDHAVFSLVDDMALQELLAYKKSI